MADFETHPAGTANGAAVYLIRKAGSFYRANSRGYTSSAIQAGRYTITDAFKITHPNGPDGPRDGMSYVHEDDVMCDDWVAYRGLAAELATARNLIGLLEGEQARAERAEAALVAKRDDLTRATFRADVNGLRAERAEAALAKAHAAMERAEKQVAAAILDAQLRALERMVERGGRFAALYLDTPDDLRAAAIRAMKGADDEGYTRRRRTAGALVYWRNERCAFHH